MAVAYDQFIATVENEAEVDHAEAERAARATLEALAERLDPTEAHDIAERLPAELAAVLEGADGPRPLSAQQFLQRVQAREHVPIWQAERHVRAVFAAMRQTIGPDEVADLVSELPHELESMLFDVGPLPQLEDPSAGTMTAGEFVDRVARRTLLDPAAARRAIAVVLEALADRISGGEAADVAERLPAELRGPLDARVAGGDDAAGWLPLKQWLIAVAAREGVSRAQARLHVRAVLATLREAIGEDELADVASQLPSEFRSLMPAS